MTTTSANNPKTIRERWHLAFPARPVCVTERQYEALAWFVAGKSQVELVGVLGITRERVRQLVAAAHQRLDEHEARGAACPRCQAITQPRPKLTWREQSERRRDAMRRKLDERAAARAQEARS